MGKGSYVPRPSPYILKSGRKIKSHLSNFISPYPTPFNIIFFKESSQWEISTEEAIPGRPPLWMGVGECAEAGWTWVPRQAFLCTSMDNQQTTQGRNFKYSHLNRLKFERGGGRALDRGKKKQKGGERNKGRLHEAPCKLFLWELTSYYNTYFSKISSHYLNAVSILNPLQFCVSWGEGDLNNQTVALSIIQIIF